MKIHFIFILVFSFIISTANLFGSNARQNPLILGGTINGSTTVCSGSNSGALNLVGNTANVVRWEYSLTGGAPWATINSTNNSLPYANLIASTYFRAVVSDGINESTLKSQSINTQAHTISRYHGLK